MGLYKDWKEFTDKHPILEVWFVMSSIIVISLILLASYVEIVELLK